MSTALAARNFHSLRYGLASTAVSPASAALEALYEEALAHLCRPAIQCLPLAALLAEIDELYDRCSEPGWDGYGALAISEDTYEEARQFVHLLPSVCPTPSVTPEPSGHITFEWYRSPRRVLVVSLDGTRTLVYAGLYGVRKRSGTEPYEASLPAIIIDSLSRLYAQ